MPLTSCVFGNYMQACDRPELLLRRPEVHRPDLRVRHEQHPSGHDLRDGRDFQVYISCVTEERDERKQEKNSCLIDRRPRV